MTVTAGGPGPVIRRDRSLVTRKPHRFALGLLLAVLAIWAGVMAVTLRQAALPDDRGGRMVVLFPLDWPEDRAFTSILAAEGYPLRRSFLGRLWVVRAEDRGFVGRLKDAGALAAFDSFAFDLVPLGGCVFLSTGRGLPFTLARGAGAAPRSDRVGDSFRASGRASGERAGADKTPDTLRH